MNTPADRRLQGSCDGGCVLRHEGLTVQTSPSQSCWQGSMQAGCLYGGGSHGQYGGHLLEPGHPVREEEGHRGSAESAPGATSGSISQYVVPDVGPLVDLQLDCCLKS